MSEFSPLDPRTLRPSVLVSDFDGTLAHPDFYQLVRRRLVPTDTPEYWEAYRSGEITHFEALRSYFAAAEGGEQALLQLLEAIELPSDLSQQQERLAAANWSVIIVSAGCHWYIDRLLQRAGVELRVITNPGRIEQGRLLMRRPESSAFFSHENGVDKSSVVKFLLDSGKHVAYCGDGFTDFPAARLVSDQRRFARADLADACREHGISFRAFTTWVDVVDGLVQA